MILPVGWFIGTVYEAIAGVFGLPPTLPLPGAVGALAVPNATSALRLASDPPLADPEPVTVTNGEPADSAAATETGEADDPSIMTSTDTPTGTEPDGTTAVDETSEMSVGKATSTGDVTENAAPDKASTDPTAANAPQTSADDRASSRPALPADKDAPADGARFARAGEATLLAAPPRCRPPDHPVRGLRRREGAAGPSSVASSPTKSSSPGTIWGWQLVWRRRRRFLASRHRGVAPQPVAGWPPLEWPTSKNAVIPCN